MTPFAHTPLGSPLVVAVPHMPGVMGATYGEAPLERRGSRWVLEQPATTIDQDDPLPPDEDGEVEQGAKMDPHGAEPQDDPLPEGLEDDEP